MILVPVFVMVYPYDVVVGIGLAHVPHPLADRFAATVSILPGDGESNHSLTWPALISRRPAQTCVCKTFIEQVFQNAIKYNLIFN